VGGKLSRADLALPEFSPDLAELGEEAIGRLLDAATWLGLLPPAGESGQIDIPHESLLGLLIRQPGFAML
jgi:hypothetical protein